MNPFKWPVHSLGTPMRQKHAFPVNNSRSYYSLQKNEPLIYRRGWYGPLIHKTNFGVHYESKRCESMVVLRAKDSKITRYGHTLIFSSCTYLLINKARYYNLCVALLCALLTPHIYSIHALGIVSYFVHLTLSSWSAGGLDRAGNMWGEARELQNWLVREQKNIPRWCWKGQFPKVMECSGVC